MAAATAMRRAALSRLFRFAVPRIAGEHVRLAGVAQNASGNAEVRFINAQASKNDRFDARNEAWSRARSSFLARSSWLA